MSQNTPTPERPTNTPGALWNSTLDGMKRRGESLKGSLLDAFAVAVQAGRAVRNTVAVVGPIASTTASFAKAAVNNPLTRTAWRTTRWAGHRLFYSKDAAGNRFYNPIKARRNAIALSVVGFLAQPAFDATLYFSTAKNIDIYTTGRVGDGTENLRVSGCSVQPCEDKGTNPESRLRMFEAVRSYWPWSYNTNPMRTHASIPQGPGFCRLSVYGPELYFGRTPIFLPNIKSATCRPQTQQEQNEGAERMRLRMEQRLQPRI